MNKEKNQNGLTSQTGEESIEASKRGGEQMDAVSSRKKIVDGIHEVFAGISQAFEGLAQMFEGVSEQMDILGDAAECEEEDLLRPLKVMVPKGVTAGTKQDTVKKPRKTPEKKAKPPAQNDAEQPEDTQTDADVTPAEEYTEESGMEASQPDEAQPEDSPEAEEPSHPEEDTLPWEAPKEDKKNAITKDEVTAVIVAKIKQNRKNNEKIGKLLSAYGVSALSDLPAEKYEAFLTDITQI